MDLSKDAFWVLPVLIIFPLVPIGWSTSVEATACTEIKKALGRFFSGVGNNFLG